MHFNKYPDTTFIFSLHFFKLPRSLHFSSLLSLFPSATLKRSESGERTDCTHRHSNTVLMMATSVTWRFHLRASGRRMGCEATAQLTLQFLPSNLLPSHFSLYLFINVCTLPLFRQPVMRLNRHLIKQVGLLCLVTTRGKSNLTPQHTYIPHTHTRATHGPKLSLGFYVIISVRSAQLTSSAEFEVTRGCYSYTEMRNIFS